MKLGELIDAIRRVEEAERYLEDAIRSAMFGGNAETIKAKNETVTSAEWWLNEIRNEDL